MKALDIALKVEAFLSDARREGRLACGEYFADDLPACTMGQAMAAMGITHKKFTEHSAAGGAGLDTDFKWCVLFGLDSKHEERFQLVVNEVIKINDAASCDADLSILRRPAIADRQFDLAAQVLVSGIKECDIAE